MSVKSSGWQGLIRRFKSALTVLAMLSFGALVALVPNLLETLRNPTQPQEAKIGQLVREEIGLDRYVTVAGTAYYEVGYTETKDENTVATVYALVDMAAGDLVFVRTPRAVPAVESEAVTLVGITRGSSKTLRALIERDLPDFQAAGLTTTPKLYLAQGQKPTSAGLLILGIAAAGLVLILALVALFVPNAVFRPSPIDPSVVPVAGGFVTKATGRFQKLKQAPPSVELAKGTRKFLEANANLVPLEAQRLMVYIHLVETRKSYGITVGRQESDWAAFVAPSHTLDVVPGTLSTGRDRPAVRLRYNDEQGKAQELFLTLDDAGAQAGLLNVLRERGFPVGTGSPVPA